MNDSRQHAGNPMLWVPGQTWWQRSILLLVLAYEALGCLAGGAMLVAAPDGRLMKMPVDLMHGVFSDFLIPGLILFGLGTLNTVAFFAVFYRRKRDWIWTGVAVGGLIIWFWVEVIIIREFHWLHAMWALPVIIGAATSLPLFPGNIIRGLLICGVLSSLWFIAADIVASSMWADYHFTNQAFSELTAIEAPTRTFLIYGSGIGYNLLVLAFALGVWMRSDARQKKVWLRLSSVLLVVHVVSGFVGGSLFPMHSRGMVSGPTLTDTIHIASTGVEVLAMLLVLIFAANQFDRRFRAYTFFTIFLLLAGGGIAAAYGPAVAAQEPTPGLGLVERMNIYGFMVWVIVFAKALMRIASDKS